MYSKFVLCACLVALVSARTTPLTSQNALPDDESTQRSSDSNSYMGDLRFLYKIYQECSAKDVTSCLKTKLITALDRASRTYSEVNLFDGITFVKESNAVETEPIKTEAELEASLPRALAEKEDTLNSMIVQKVADFFQTHTLQIKLPSATEIARSFSEESRGKKDKKKMGGLIAIPLLLGGTLIPLALGALALLAGKALIVSKLALVLAAIIGLKKLIGSSHGGGHHETGHVEVGHSSGGSGSGGWGRSLGDDGQNLAYRAHAPTSQ